MRMLTLTAVVFMLNVAWSSSNSMSITVLSDWEVQSYLTPQPTREQAAIEYKNQILLIGGVISNGPDANRFVYNLDLERANQDREWETFADIPEDLLPEPWYHSTNNAFYIGNDIYVACDDNTAIDTNDIFIFDPIQKTFSPIENGKFPTDSEDCCAVPNGEEIYIVGGADSMGNDRDLVQIFNIRTKQWRQGAKLDVGIQNVKCVNVADDFIYVFGGFVDGVTTDGVRKYSFKYDEWELLDNRMSIARGDTAVTQIGNTPYLLLTGGVTVTASGPAEILNLVEVWNVDHDELDIDLSLQIPDLSVARAGHAGIIISKQTCLNRKWNVFTFNVYAIGGEISQTAVADTTEILKLMLTNYKM